MSTSKPKQQGRDDEPKIRLTGTFIAVMLLGVFIVISWFGIYALFLSK